MKPHRACTHDRQPFCQPSSIYLNLRQLIELLMWTVDVTDWVKQECVYRTGWHTVWRTMRKTLTMFSVVSYIMKIMFTSAVTRTKRPRLWTATPTPWTWANDAKRNFIYRQLHKYRPSYITFPPANFLLLTTICQFMIPGKRIRYAVQFMLLKTHKCALQL